MPQQVSDWLSTVAGISEAMQGKLLATLITILALFALRVLVVRIVSQRFEDPGTLYRWRKTTIYLAFILGVLVVGNIWVSALQGISTFLGIVTAGLAIALGEPITNLAGWAFILARRPFEVGDRIQIGEHRGDVIDVRIFQFTLMEIGNWVDADQSTGRIIHVPNGFVFKQATANYSKGFQYIWDEIAVLVTFESDWKKAKEILTDIANRHAQHFSDTARRKITEAAKKYMIFYSNLTPIVYTGVKDSGIMLTLRFLCEPRRRRTMSGTIWEEILERFGECDDIDFAYPTQRFYDNVAEGKPQTRPMAPDQ